MVRKIQKAVLMTYSVKWYPFSEHPESDSCWSLSVGPDGRIYAASCSECSPGQTAKVVRYNEATDRIDYLFDIDKAVDDPRDSGRATQCKIHYSFAPSLTDGVLYMATHLSGPPIDQPVYSPWMSWHDPKRCFRGSAVIAFDTLTDEILWWDTMIPREGCRCLLHDEERGLLYAISYPRDHLYRYEIKKRRLHDLGRIGSINSQALFMDSCHRVWTSNDDGRFIRYDPEKDRLESSPYLLPHNPAYQTGWHSVLYDVVASPERDCVYAVTWIAEPHLFRFWPEEGNWGRLEDFGPATQQHDLTIPIDTFSDHAGGLVFGADGMLYYVASRWRDSVSDPHAEYERDLRGIVWRVDPKTRRREEVAELKRPDALANYVSRGACDSNGDLFFSNVCTPEHAGFFKVALPMERKKPDAHLPIRIWG